MAKLRDTKTSTQEPSQSQQHRKTAREELDAVRRLEIYRREVKSCREEANAAAEKDRELLTGLLRVWRSIKELRRSSRVHSTSIRLLIRKEEVDQAKEEEWRKVELEEEVKEILEERQQEYEAQSKRYEKEIATWKCNYKKRVSKHGRAHNREPVSFSKYIWDNSEERRRRRKWLVVLKKL